jgi:hypothetical protein
MFCVIYLDELMRRNQENARLNTEILELRRELDDSKSQLVIAGITLENNFEQEKRKANEEIATLQQLVHGESCATKVCDCLMQTFLRNCRRIEFLTKSVRQRTQKPANLHSTAAE